MQGAKIGLVDYISRHPYQKAKKTSDYDEEFIGAKLNLISASANSLSINSSQSAPYLHNSLKTCNPSLRITTDSESTLSSLNRVNTFDTRLHKH